MYPGTKKVSISSETPLTRRILPVQSLTEDRRQKTEDREETLSSVAIVSEHGGRREIPFAGNLPTACFRLNTPAVSVRGRGGKEGRMKAGKKMRMLVAGLCLVLSALAMVLGGCHLWYQDMKGYLEHWTGTVQVSGLEWSSAPESQRDSSGRYSIPINASVTATVSIANPDGYSLDGGVGSSRDTLRSVRIAGVSGSSVLPLASVVESGTTGITLEIRPVSPVSTPASLELEHTDFTITFVPTRSDSGQSTTTTKTLTLRYNTPPRMPLEVAYSPREQVLGWLGEEHEVNGWELVQGAADPSLDGYLYWAWPKDKTEGADCDPRDPDRVREFHVYVGGTFTKKVDVADVVEVRENLISSQLADYNVYRVQAPSGIRIEVYALDREGVRSYAAGSGIAPHKITLDAGGGIFPSSGVSQVELYKAAGSPAVGGDFETPYREGYYLSGWMKEDDNLAIFPLKIDGPMTLTAQWEKNPPVVVGGAVPGGGTGSSGTGTVPSGGTGGGASTTTYTTTYTITYNGNGADDGATPESQTKVAGKTVVLQGNSGNLTRTGCTFAGWNTRADGQGTSYAAGAAYGTDGTVTLYAKWIAWGTSDWGGYLSSLEAGSHTVVIDSHLAADDVYALREAIANTPSVQICLDLSGATFDNNRLPEDAFNGECTSLGVLPNLVEVVLPDGLTSIGERAFAYAGLKSVDIPNSVQTIEWDAFYECNQLSKVTMEDGVQTIGQGVFHGCTALTSVDIPKTVTSIGPWAFEESGLTDVTIPGSVQTIGGSAFLNCTQLASVTIEEGVQTIGGYAFQLTGLTDVTVPGSVETIGQDAFADCAQLDSVTIKAGVQTIGQGAFHDCPVLNSVTIEDGVTSIEPWAFDNCSSLTSVTIPGSVETIGEDAFRSCSALTSVTIGEGVETIGKGAFIDCTRLASVTMGEGVETIGEGAFHGCAALASVDIPKTVTSIEPWAFEETGLTDVTIPSSVETIGGSAFFNCAQLTSVTIEEGVQTIDGYAFANCSNLTSVDIPDSVTAIGEKAFHLTGLTDVTIPGSVENIGQDAFSGCPQLASVTVEEGVKNIGQGAFHDCDQLTSVTIKKGVQTIGQDAFYGCDQLSIVTMEEGVESIGQGTFYGCSALTTVDIPGTVTSIGSWAFQHSGLSNVTIPGSVTSIGRDAFHSCAQLTSVTIENGVQTIEQGAFYGCSALTTVDIPDTVTSIGYGAFQNSGLTSVNIGNGVTSIGACGFQNTSLTSVTIPASVKTIGTSAFNSCTALTRVDIANGVHTIEGDAFGSSGLTSVTIPGSVKTIGNHAFANCRSLTSVTIEEGVPSIGHGNFDGCTALATLTLPVSVTTIDSYNFRSTPLATVNYCGTEEQWGKITIHGANSNLTGAPKTYSYTGP